MQLGPAAQKTKNKHNFLLNTGLTVLKQSKL
jgi:hypothetical protein